MRTRVPVFILAIVTFVAAGAWTLSHAPVALGDPTQQPGIGSGSIATNATGSVAIGTDTFSASKLRVAGSIESTTGGFVFPDGTTQTTASTGGGVTSTPAGYVTPGTFNSVAGTGGNYGFPASVAVGTTTPADTLHVWGASGVNAGIKISSNFGFINNFLKVVDGTYTDGLQIQKGDGIALMSFDNTNLRVGVGTTTPAVDFHIEKSVVGTVESRIRNVDTGASQALLRINADHAGSLMFINRGSGQTASYLGRASNSWADIIGASGGGSGLAISTNSATPLVFGTNGTERFRIDSAGLLTVATNRITGLSTPTASSDAATKGYVDSVVGAQYMGLTGTTYTGNLGSIAGANAKCNSAYSGSHMCTQSEALRTGATTFGGSGWIACDLLTYLESSGGWACSGVTYSNTNTTNQSCSQWASAAAGASGPYMDTNGFVNSATCNNSLAIMCCK